jgi:flagellar hook-length control protein FliK
MAAILNPGGSIVTSTPAGASNATSGAGTPPAGDMTDLFTQLIAQMVGAATAQSTQSDSALQDLAGLSIEGEPIELTGDDRKSDTDVDESDDEDAAAALALAALLPVLSTVKPMLPGTTNAGGDSADRIEGALLARSAETDISQAAIEELTGDSSESTNASAAPADTKSAAGAQNTTPSVQIHTMLATHAARDADAVPDTTIQAPVGSPAWKDELGTQLTWMALNGREAASLKLSPEHLGPLDIRISMREGEASVYFGAANPDTRSALEQSLPRLRELFASQGLVLADAGVSRDAPRNAFKPSPQNAGPRSISDASAEPSVTSITLARVGLVDTYV